MLMRERGSGARLVHSNRPAKAEQFREWTRDSVRAGLFQQEFTTILLRMLDLINEIAEVSRHELEQDSG